MLVNNIKLDTMKMKMFGVSLIASIGTLMLDYPKAVNGIHVHHQPVDDYLSFAESISSSNDDVQVLAETNTDGVFGDKIKAAGNTVKNALSGKKKPAAPAAGAGTCGHKVGLKRLEKRNHKIERI